MNFKLTLEYDGSAFAGWQKQAQGERTVQGALEAALQTLGRAESLRVIGAGRTDAGVHAEGQVASVDFETALEPATLRRALNAILPPAMAVLAVEQARPGFDARSSAASKLYRYAIWNGPVRSPLRERRAWGLSQALDVDAMRRGCCDLVGEHDFACFRAAGSGVESSVRRILRLDCSTPSQGEIRLEVVGTGFLRRMVRNIAGTLVEVGLGRRPADSLPALLESRDRSQAGMTAPAQGLTLVRVDYRNDD